MATLVLTVVGGIVGGPIGASIGAAIGQSIDRNVLFVPKGRQGPRLTELALQTSSYGTAIPHVFGTMRVGGCVIWSTDLIESRSSARSGKGQPKVTNYSYSASFAVALSGRAIVGVGRIWADGKLLRGAAGDFKTATGFRLHDGDEDQATDPLIAAAEGGQAPAHRGIAYAVFEDFQLADYGNRIPSLTFEVIGDAGPVGVGAMAAALSAGLVNGDVTQPIAGFAAYGDARSVLEMLAAASGAWFAPTGGGVTMQWGTVPSVTLDDTGFAAGEAAGPTGVRTIGGLEGVARTVTIAHYDPARDYQTGLQLARRPGAGQREGRLELPAAVTADEAKTMAVRELARGEAARERRTLALGWAALGLTPGACVAIAGAPGAYRVAKWSFEKMVLTLECVRLARATAATTGSSGRALPTPDLVAGTTILHAFELLPLDDTVLGVPRLMVAAAGTGAGWRQAALLYSLDDGARWLPAGGTAGVATIGVVTRVPGPGPSDLIDLVGVVEVELVQEAMVLASADMTALDAGANIALIGDELVQFGSALQTGARRWRLSALLRGRRGTEAAIGTQGVGDRFVLIEPDTVVAIDLPLSSLGAGVRVIASGIGDGAGPVEQHVAVQGKSLLPLAPVHLTAAVLPGGDTVVRWIRRSRSGWRWTDGADVPIGEETEAYRVTIVSSDGASRTVETGTSEFVVPAADRIGRSVSVGVRQAGAHGESAAATILLPTT